MNGGEAAEQTVRLAMEGAEFTLKIAGEGAERIIALLAAAMQPAPKGQKLPAQKLRGRERLRTMLRSGAELKFFEIQGKDLKEFAAAAKQYGLAYCVLRSKSEPGGMVEIMAKAEDAARITRILEKLEARDLGGTAQTKAVKSKAEVRAEKRATQQAAKAKMNKGLSEARQQSRQQFNAQRKVLAAQYRQELGIMPRERRVPRSRFGRLLRELAGEVVRHIPVIGALARRRDAAEAPAEPAREFPPPEDNLVENLLAPPPAKEGQAAPEAPAAVQPEGRTQNPPTRTGTTKTEAPSEHLSPMKSKDGEIISDRAVPVSVGAFLREKEERQRTKRREPKPPEKPRQQAPRHRQRKKIRTKKER